MLISPLDFERLTSASMKLDQGDGHLWHRQYGRFEHNTMEADTPPRKLWEWGHWLEDGWATVMLARQFLIDNGYEFEIFWDMAPKYPDNPYDQSGSWVIFTDYHRR